MWVLSPLLPSASQRAADEAALPNSVQFLTSGKITVGRPAKKGGTTGKADVLIFNESSVSNLHAVLEVQPALGGTHGALAITDSNSKFGTFVRGRDVGLQEQRLQPQQQQQLQPNDVIRFGNKMRYQLQQVPVSICPATSSGRSSSDTSFLQAAASCNISIVSSCSSSSTAGSSTQEACHVMAADGDELTSASLSALLLKLPLITPDWIAAVAAKKVHAQSLPDTEAFSTKQLLLPQAPSQQQQQQRGRCWMSQAGSSHLTCCCVATSCCSQVGRGRCGCVDLMSA
ncbi:hypothetical protein COO60DRAFT_672550 [Scenedesmus sp. NREL 46B-D3]|nr:hypothetical protein COO60DRAFT_672550 [Scenedesmus sp. NREL 46B-D3]